MQSFNSAVVETKIWNLHLSEVRFLFPVLLTTEYKVDVAQFLLDVEFCAVTLKNVV